MVAKSVHCFAVIVTDNETLLHKELEMLALRTKRVRQKFINSTISCILLQVYHNFLSPSPLPLQKSLKRSSVSTGHNAWSKHARMDSDLPSSSSRQRAPDDDELDLDNESLSSAESMT